MNTKKILTLVFLREGSKVLLGMKKRGFGAGKWNGFGGKVEPGETIVEAAVREVKEECGYDVEQQHLDETATIDFEFEGDPVLWEVHVFQTTQFSGEMQETEEMRPRWWQEQEVPFQEMWLDDQHWYPHMFKKEKFKAYFLFQGHDKILNFNIDLLCK